MWTVQIVKFKILDTGFVLHLILKETTLCWGCTLSCFQAKKEFCFQMNLFSAAEVKSKCVRDTLCWMFPKKRKIVRCFKELVPDDTQSLTKCCAQGLEFRFKSKCFLFEKNKTCLWPLCSGILQSVSKCLLQLFVVLRSCNIWNQDWTLVTYLCEYFIFFSKKFCHVVSGQLISTKYVFHLANMRGLLVNWLGWKTFGKYQLEVYGPQFGLCEHL